MNKHASSFYSVGECFDNLIQLAETYKVKKEEIFNAEENREEERPIFQNAFTDFISPLSPTYMEMAAYLVSEQIKQDFSAAELDNLFFCSLGVRGAGALCHSIANRFQRPYSLSDWYPPGSVGELNVGECVGVGGVGQLYLNGVPPEAKVVVVVDRIYGGDSVYILIDAILKADKHCTVVGVYAVMEMVYRATGEGLARTELREEFNVSMRSFLKVTAIEDNYKVEVSEHQTLSTLIHDAITNVEKIEPSAHHRRTIAERTSWSTRLRELSATEVEQRLEHITKVFVNIPIVYNKEVEYPYCYFSFTDFIPALNPAVVEDMADLCVYYLYQRLEGLEGEARREMEQVSMLVSEGDRGGASLLHAVSLRLQLPYVIAHWITSAKPVTRLLEGQRRTSVRSHVTNIGFSGGESQIALNGVEEGDVCIFVDDMLSSGGTAEAIFDCATRRGGKVAAALFASEKLYPMVIQDTPRLVRKGFERIRLLYPDCQLVTLVQFIVEGDTTQAPQQRVEREE